MKSDKSLKSQVVSASKWSALSEITAKAIMPLVYIVLARILTPEDFGVVAAATMVISFSQIFWDAGLSKAIIQREKDIEEASQIVFWTNLILSLVIYSLLFFFSSSIASIFHDQRVAPVIKIQGLQIILASLVSVQTALYQRQLNFKVLFWIRIFTSTLPGIVSIPLAFLGHVYWALVGGYLIGSLVQLIAIWLASPWRPQLKYKSTLVRELFSFGIWVSGEGLLSWFFLWADSMIVGMYLGSRDLGLYRTGNLVVTSVFALVLSPILPVLFSAFSRMQNNQDQLHQAILQATKIIAVIALPIGVGFFMLRELLSLVILGGKWQGVALVIGCLGLLNGISWLVGALSEAYRSIGKPDLNTKIMALIVCYYIPVYFLAVTHGLTFFLWTRFIVSLVSLPIHFYVAYKWLKITPQIIFHKLRFIIAATLGMAFLLHTLNYLFVLNHNVILKLIYLSIAGTLSYICLLYTERRFLITVIKNLFNK